MELHLFITGLALLWGPLDTNSPVTVYFPAADESRLVCGMPMQGDHQLNLVFDAEDLVDGSTGDYVLLNAMGRKIGREPICGNITLDGVMSPVTKEGSGGCTAADLPSGHDQRSFDCILSVSDIKPNLELKDRLPDHTTLSIPGGTLRSTRLAQKKTASGLEYATWNKYLGRSTDAMAEAAVLDAQAKENELISITGTTCSGGSLDLKFLADDGLIELELANLPRQLSHPNGDAYVTLNHMLWVYEFLRDPAGTFCHTWDKIDSPVKIKNMVVEVGSADIFCPPAEGP